MNITIMDTDELKGMGILSFHDEPSIAHALTTFMTSIGSYEWAVNIVTYVDGSRGIEVQCHLGEVDSFACDFPVAGNENFLEAMVTHRALWVAASDPAEEGTVGLTLDLCNNDITNLRRLLQDRSGRVA
jgi:hypothetical protein